MKIETPDDVAVIQALAGADCADAAAALLAERDQLRADRDALVEEGESIRAGYEQLKADFEKLKDSGANLIEQTDEYHRGSGNCGWSCRLCRAYEDACAAWDVDP